MSQKSKRIWKQFWRDAWGKDADRGVTLSYAWLANQFGHIALGAMAALIFYGIFMFTRDDNQQEFYGLLSSIVFWFLLEFMMFTTTIRRWKRTEKFPFKPNAKFLFWDIITDLGFFQLGAIIFYIPHHSDVMWVWYVFGTLFILLFFAFYYWFDVRIHQQEAHLPFTYHLAFWSGKLNEDNVHQIKQFVEGYSNIDHILLFGEIKSEKSALAVAIGNELVNRKQKTYYTSANEFLRTLYESEANLKEYRDGHNMWNWRECDVIVIDHINPGAPVPDDLLSAVDMKKHILNPSYGKMNQAALSRQKVIWAVGDLYEDDRGKQSKLQWKMMLQEIGISENAILITEIGRHNKH